MLEKFTKMVELILSIIQKWIITERKYKKKHFKSKLSMIHAISIKSINLPQYQLYMCCLNRRKKYYKQEY